MIFIETLLQYNGQSCHKIKCTLCVLCIVSYWFKQKFIHPEKSYKKIVSNILAVTAIQFQRYIILVKSMEM